MELSIEALQRMQSVHIMDLNRYREVCGEPHPFFPGTDEEPLCHECRGIYLTSRFRRGNQ